MVSAIVWSEQPWSKVRRLHSHTRPPPDRRMSHWRIRRPMKRCNRSVPRGMRTTEISTCNAYDKNLSIVSPPKKLKGEHQSPWARSQEQRWQAQPTPCRRQSEWARQTVKTTPGRPNHTKNISGQSDHHGAHAARTTCPQANTSSHRWAFGKDTQRGYTNTQESTTDTQLKRTTTKKKKKKKILIRSQRPFRPA